jgi:hypothetical protein
VVADDLSSIPYLQDKHRRVLADELKITTLRALVQADRRDVHRALRNFRPRPTLELIARWQDDARSRLSEAAMDPADWHTAASFAVVFAQRQVGGGWEHRIEIERTEVEPEQEGRTWPDWDCQEICGWMRGQLGLQEAGPRAAPEPAPQEPAPQEPTAEEPATQEPAARAGGTAPAPARPARPRGRGDLTIGRVTLIDPGAQVGPVAAGTAGASQVDVVTSHPAAEAPPASPAGPLRVELKVSGGRRGQEIHAVARVLPRDEPGWNAHDPVVITGTGPVSLDLSGLPAGSHEVALIAWTPDGSMRPAAVTLPELTISPAQPPV